MAHLTSEAQLTFVMKTRRGCEDEDEDEGEGGEEVDAAQLRGGSDECWANERVRLEPAMAPTYETRF